MPPRLNKRQQREQDELEALASFSKINETSEKSDEEPESLKSISVAKGAVGFAALLGDEEYEDERLSEQDETAQAPKPKKSKKKKKKGAAISTSEAPHAAPRSSKTMTKSSQNESKSKSKSKVDEDEDFDKVLAELSGKYSNIQIANPQIAKPALLSAYDAFHTLISVSLKHLDPDTELRRFFGSKVITSSSSTSGSRSSRIRSNLTRPQPAWPPAQYRAGLSMRPLTSDEILLKTSGVSPDTRERWWTIESSPRYKGATYEYLQCVMGGDPQLFYNLMYEMPWHADTLLQMAEVYRHREEYSTATDFMSRVLFAYERAFASTFNITNGIHRLDFDHVENRVFSLALARTIVDLNRRGTPRTAFEFARLLYSLEPHTDPHGALLHLDSLAIKAKQTDWLIALWDAFEKMDMGKDGEARFDVTLLPGWHWSRALALFEREGDGDEAHVQSTTALKDAIIAFPSIAPLLVDKLDINMSHELRRLSAFRIMTDYNSHGDDFSTSLIHLLSHIYVIRSVSVWKVPSRCSWLSKCLTSLSPSDVSPSVPPRPLTRFKALFDVQSNISDAIYRHIITTAPLTLEFRRLTAFFPENIRHRVEHNIEGDPLPPLTAVTVYNDGYFLNISRRNVPSAPDRMADHIAGLFANPQGQGELQAMFDANPALAARFPGGLAEMAAMARQFPQELFDAMMGVLAGDPNAAPPDEHLMAEGRMPGGEQILAVDDTAVQPDEHIRDENLVADHGAGDEQEEQPQGFLPFRIFQTLLGRVWGPTNESDGSDSDEPGGTEGFRPNDVD